MADGRADPPAGSMPISGASAAPAPVSSAPVPAGHPFAPLTAGERSPAASTGRIWRLAPAGASRSPTGPGRRTRP